MCVCLCAFGCTSSQAALAFADVIRSPGRLQELDLSLNFLAADGVAAIADALTTAPVLRRLQLNGCYLKPEGVIAIGVPACASVEPSVRERGRTVFFPW